MKARPRPASSYKSLSDLCVSTCADTLSSGKGASAIAYSLELQLCRVPWGASPESAKTALEGQPAVAPAPATAVISK